MSVDGRGHLFVQRSPSASGLGSRSFVEYDTEGRRVGTRELPGRRLGFLPGSRAAWVGLYDEVVRLDEEGEEIARIRRRPDRTWLGVVEEMAVGPAGSLALLDGGLNLYGPEGEPRARLRVPTLDPRGSAFGLVHAGEWAAVGYDHGRVLLVRLEDGATRMFQPREEEDLLYEMAVPPGGDELWLFDRESRRLTRYALPR